MKLLVGCPIYKRDWILRSWIACLAQQSVSLADIGFIFEVDENDHQTIRMLEAWRQYDKSISHFEIIPRADISHFEHLENGRQWTISRYENMVSLRNSLLRRCRELEPDFYFSLDSDILLTNHATLELLMAHVKSGADAVNPLLFMTPEGIQYPSVMSWKEGLDSKAYRQESYPLGTYFQADVIMAAKMMSQKVYNNIDYKMHLQGEDVGWSHSCKEAGYSLYCASYIYAPHIMNPLMFKSFLKDGDPRQAVSMRELSVAASD